MTQLVEKGDLIRIEPSTKDNVTIKWQQDLGNRQEPYVAFLYSVKDKDAAGSLFVSFSKKQEFLKKAKPYKAENFMDSDGYEIQVDDAFQYGQNNEKTLRFLVYHDKATKPYQHRFIETTVFSNIGNKIAAVGETAAGEAWGKLVKQGLEIGKAFIGDYLRDF